MTLKAADRFASDFARPQCWAVVIDAKLYVFAREYGIRFADLVAERLAASQGVSLRRKEPGRAIEAQEARRAVA
jgi:hypothetical protein